jgi:subtilisin family serine protease
MAGLIAGNGRVLGVAPEAKILPVRVGRIDVILSDNLIKGMDWAVAHGAKVLSLSLATTDAYGFRDAIDRAIAADVVIVAAVGNTDKDSIMRYPGRYPGVVAVGGVDRNGDHSAVSVEGNQVALSAPSDLISSLRPGNDYGVGTGTSDATALVAGAAALVRAKFPQLSAVEVVHRLTATADDRGPPGRDDTYGYGIVDVVKALTADVPPATTAATPGGGDPGGEMGGRLIVGIVGGVVFVLAMVILGVVFLRRR